MWLSHMAWPCLTLAFQHCSLHGGKACTTLCLKPSQVLHKCVEAGRRPWGTRQPCEGGGPVPSYKLCHEAVWPSPARAWPGPAWACFHARVLEPAFMFSLSTCPQSKSPSRMDEPVSPLLEGKPQRLVNAGNSPYTPEQACITCLFASA